MSTQAHHHVLSSRPPRPRAAVARAPHRLQPRRWAGVPVASRGPLRAQKHLTRKHPTHRSPGRSAFTLIELLVVVSILSLLISIALPSFRNARRMAKDTLCTTNLRSIYVAQSLFLDEGYRFQPLNNEKNDGKWQYNYLIYDGRDWKANFGPLITNKKRLPEPKLLYCPQQKDPFHMLDTSDNPWPPKNGLDTRASYARRFLLTGKAMSDFKKNLALFSDLIHLPKVIRTGHKKGVNAAFVDGHVSWVADPGIMRHNELVEPFSELDNPIIAKIWAVMDKRQ